MSRKFDLVSFDFDLSRKYTLIHWNPLYEVIIYINKNKNKTCTTNNLSFTFNTGK